MSKGIRSICLGILVLVTWEARASILFRTSVHYSSFERKTEDDVGEWKTARTLFDINALYSNDKGFAGGFLYQMDRIGGHGFSYSNTHYGPTVGWISQRDIGPYVLLHYILNPTPRPNDAVTYRMAQGDVGLRVLLRKFFLTVQFSYKYFSAASKTETWKDTNVHIDPSFGIMVPF